MLLPLELYAKDDDDDEVLPAIKLPGHHSAMNSRDLSVGPPALGPAPAALGVDDVEDDDEAAAAAKAAVTAAGTVA